MRMINRTRKEGLGNGFQVVLSFLAARTRRAIAGVRPAQLKEGKPHVLLAAVCSPEYMLECFASLMLDWGARVWLGKRGLAGGGVGWGRSLGGRGSGRGRSLGAESGWEEVWLGAESGWEGVWLGAESGAGRSPDGRRSGWGRGLNGDAVWLGVKSRRGCMAKGTSLPGRVILVDSEISLGKLRIMMLDGGFGKPVLLEARAVWWAFPAPAFEGGWWEGPSFPG